MEEKLTEDLLNELLFSNSVSDYFEQETLPNRSLSEYLNELLEQHKLKKSEIIRQGQLDPTYAYEIFSGAKTSVARDKVLQLAFGMHLDVRETQRLLKHAGVSELYVKQRRDALILYCVGQGYSLEKTEQELFRFGQETITKL